jgi:glyoxylase-like metal-dependent hydrolase (beta-lactamase superfamily II)
MSSYSPIQPATPPPCEAHITAIDVEYIRPGLACSHLVTDGGRAAFVDTGTTHAVPLLLNALHRSNLQPVDVDYVLLTHIHLDHAGGAGALLQHLPNATCVVHPRGAAHLTDPAKLITGSKAVYGDEAFARLYGDIAPIAADRMVTGSDGETLRLGQRSLQFIHTAGHALHHYCIVDPAAQIIFAGDTFGVSYRAFDTQYGAFIFPAATPVHFDPVAAHASIERLLSYQPRAIYVTHYSRVSPPQTLAAQLHQGIDVYVEIARRWADHPEPVRSEQISSDMFTYFSAQLDQRGYRGTASERHALLDDDIRLNVQGLNVWIDRNRN